MIPTQRSTAVLDKVACDISNQSCMCDECATCSDPSIQINHNVDRAASSTATHNDTIGEFVGAANTLMPRFKRHHFNMKHQQAYMRSNVQDNECMVHIDCAENYLG